MPLDLLTTYNAIMQPDEENIKKHKNFWQNLAKKLQTLGYNVSIITLYIYIYIYGYTL